MSDRESQPEVTWVPQGKPPVFLICLITEKATNSPKFYFFAELSQPICSSLCSLKQSCYQSLGNVIEPDFSYGKPTRQKYEKLAGKSFTRKYLAQHGVCSEGVIFNGLLQMLI